MKTFKKLAIACALASGLAFSMSANALGPFFSNIEGMQLNPTLQQAFLTSGSGVTFGDLQFRVRGPANCIDHLGYEQICHVALDHLDMHHGYYLTVTPFVQTKTKRLMTEINAYPDYETVLLTYSKPYLAGSALNVVDIKNMENI